MLRLPEEERFVLFAISPIIDNAMAGAVASYLGRVSDLGIQLGAKRHLGTGVQFDQARWRSHCGDCWKRLGEVKRRCDPFGILGPGVIPFDTLETRASATPASRACAARGHAGFGDATDGAP